MVTGKRNVGLVQNKVDPSLLNSSNVVIKYNIFYTVDSKVTEMQLSKCHPDQQKFTDCTAVDID